ncbi:MAG: DPP IV N-terminal domain-containing protein, partial [Sphingomonadales bacterium]
MRFALPFALLLATAAPAATPFEPADLYRISMVDAVATAPSGKQVLFSRASFDIQTDRRVTEWWLAAINGINVSQRLLIGAGTAARSPAWSPDGSRIAYVAPFAGKPQLWVMALADGVGRPITSGTIAPGAPIWSPDGQSIAFVARVEVPAPKVAGMPAKPDGATWAPEPKLITDYSWRTNDGGYIKPGADHLFVVPASGGTPKQLTSGSSDQISGDPSWAPDGQSLVYAAQLRPGNEAMANESDLYRISATGGAPERLTAIDSSESQPKISPDGKQLAWIGALKTSKFYAQPGLWVRSLTGGTPVQLAATLDRPITRAEWAADGKSLLAIYNDAGMQRVAHIPLAGGTPQMKIPAVGGTRLYLPSSGGDWSCAAATCAFT